MVIDYSKWDNIETDSDDELMTAQRLKAPKPSVVRQTPEHPAEASMSAASDMENLPKVEFAGQKWDYINLDPDPEDGPTTSNKTNASQPGDVHQAPVQPTRAPTFAAPTDTQASSERIKAVIVRCDGDPAPGLKKWSATTITGEHPIFKQQVEAPLPAALELPLAFHRLPSSQFKKSPSSLDNQIITYLNIELESGFAPPAWQSEVGTVLVARLDKKPFLEQDLEALWQYCDYILDLFGDGDGPPKHLYNRRAFEKHWMNYADEMRDMGRDDWDDIPTPYQWDLVPPGDLCT